MNDAQLSRLEAKREKMRHFRELEEAARLSQTAPALKKSAKVKKPKVRKPDREVRTRKPLPRVTECSECKVALRPHNSSAADFPGTRLHEGKGMCGRCRALHNVALVGTCAECEQPMRPHRVAAIAFDIPTVEHTSGGVCRPCRYGAGGTRGGSKPVHDGSTKCKTCDVVLRPKYVPPSDGSTRTVGKALPNGEGWLCTTCYARLTTTATPRRPHSGACTRCEVPIVTRGHEKPEGGRFHGGNGLCTACASADDKAKKRARAQERIAA